MYQQPPTTGAYTSWGSTNTPDANISVTYDNFTLPAAASIAIVNWQGLYVDPVNESENPESENTSSFIISFWSDNAGQPGTMLSSQTIPIANANAVELPNVSYYFTNTGDTGNVSLYAFSAGLPTPFAAAAGTPYWISIVSNCTADQPRWQWTSGTGGDNACVQDLGSGRYNVSGDRAFTLATSHPTFFKGEADLGSSVYYLSFSDGNYFGYYSYLTDPDYLYHYDLGYEYVFDAKDGKGGVYLYDFASSDFFYTSPSFPFPYLYDFGLNSVVYYYPDPKNAGHYNTDGIRYFYVFSSGKIISK